MLLSVDDVCCGLGEDIKAMVPQDTVYQSECESSTYFVCKTKTCSIADNK